MKKTINKIMSPISRSMTAVLAAFALQATRQLATGADADLDQQFPQVIQHDLGASGFSAGDHITITSVRGDRNHIEPGGSYLVEGSYTLASGDSADLALFCTTRGPSGPTPVQDGQRVKITRGTGRFRLYETNVPDGWLHVSFYPANSKLHGGVYLGEQGKESTIMRDQEWFREFTVKSPGMSPTPKIGVANEANRALLAYLGDPIAPPTGMDSRYNQANLLKAFTNLCQQAGLTITKLVVDDSEFPFLVYGTLAGRHTLPDAPAFEAQKGYTYGGSVRGSFDEDSTYFAVNMVPNSQFPADKEPACHRRLMLRLQMLADRAQQTQ